MSNNEAIEAAQAELDRCERAVAHASNEHDKANAELLRTQTEYNAALDRRYAARYALEVARRSE